MEDNPKELLDKIASDLTKCSSQPLAMSMSSFHMTSTLKFAAELALASGG